MSRNKRLVPALVRGAIGFAAGAALWLGLSETYHRTLAPPAQALIRTFEPVPVTRLRAEKREIIVEREDFPPSSPRPGIPADDLDFNIAILLTLFATVRRPLSDTALKRLFAALAILWATHVAAIVFAAEALYASSLGPWSAEHYGWIARNVWATGHHFYRIAGMFAIPFVLWWSLALHDFRSPRAAASGVSRRRA